MYTRIMAAVDDSFITSKVLKTAIELAGFYKAKLAICHAIDLTVLSQKGGAMLLISSVEQIEKNLRNEAKLFLDRAVEDARAAGADAEALLVDSEVIHVPDMLANAAADWQADLLVAGAHGEGGMERFFVGSVAQRLVVKVKTSLMLVRSA